MSEEIKKGLLGIVVDETTISHVVPELSTLTYRGYTVQELCDKCDFEEVAYLVLHGELPNKKQLKKFIKDERSERKLSKQILKDIQKFELEDRIVVTSYDFRNLYELKKQNSNVLRGFITLQQDLSTTKKNVYEGSPWMAKTFPLEDLFLLPNLIKSLEGHVWSVFYRDLTKQNVELAHKHGLAVNVWTVNREKDIIKMIDYGVDGIITYYPKKVQDICKLKNIEWF